jgi:hypothetical protein
MYAQVINNIWIQDWPDAPCCVSYPDGLHVGFPDGATDSQYAEQNIFPVVVTDVPRDQYHTYSMDKSVVDGLPVGTRVATEVSLDQVKQIKRQQTDMQWINALKYGSFTSQSILGFQVDCRRNSGEGRSDNDVQNMESYLEGIAGGIVTTPYFWTGCTETRSGLTLEQLQSLQLEMIGYGLSCYQRHAACKTAIDNATTFNEVVAVTF